MSPKPSDAAPRGGLGAWAAYEWARNPYVLLITLFIFAPYFARDLVGDTTRGQILWGEIVGYGGIAVAVLAPFLGAIADAGGRRKPWVLFYSLVMIVAECLLWLPQPGGIGLSLFATGAAVALANVAYDFSTVFHGAMLPSLARRERIGTWSGAGYALGNVAGLILLIVVVVMPGAIGLDKATHEPDRIAGPLCALWFALFSVPFFLLTPDRPSKHLSWGTAVTRGLASVGHTVTGLRHYKNIALYLAARTIYNDGTSAMLAFGGVYATGTFHWELQQVALYGILVTVFAAIGAFAGGRLADRIGAKTTILMSLTGTLIGGALSLGFTPDHIFYVVPVTPGVAAWPSPVFSTLPEILYVADIMFVALCIVGTWANSRTMLARIAPEERMAEFFGLYALSGTATTFMAPFVIAALTAWTGSQRAGIAAPLGFLVLGILLMLPVKETRATAV